MGFWNTLGKMVQGKPIFEPPKDAGASATDEPTAEVVVPVRPGYDAKGNKIIPKIAITRCQTQTSGDNMQVWAWIKNEADTPLRLERMTMVGMTRQLGNFLTPGEQEQVLVYSGVRPRITSYTKAELYYVQMNTNDYFCAEHQIEYDYESDGTYTVSELEPYSYVRDV